MKELPSPWIVGLLADIAHVEMGQSPDSRFYNEHGEGLPFFQGKAEFGSLYPTVRKWCSQPTKVAEAGDILLSVRAPVGPTNLANQQCCIGRGLSAIRVTAPFSQKYLLHYFRHIEPWLAAQGTGSTFTSVSGGFLRELEVPLAPLSEQKRITDKLDTILSRVDACRKHLDRIPTILKRFRQALLAAATSGILTKEWRAEREIDASWSNGTLEFLLDGKPRNGYSPRSVDKITSVKALTLTSTTSGKFRGEYFKYIDEDIPKNSYLWLQPDDILIQRANTLEYVGSSVLYEGLPSEFIYPDLMMKARANSQILPRFLLYILQSDKVRHHFRVNATGTAGNMPKINQSTILTAPASWPIIEEQLEIVRRAEELLAYADRIESRYQAARARVDKLTPAILAKAFRGELVPQDPNDEPASVLLERIQASRLKSEAKSKPKHSRNKKISATDKN